MNAKTYDTTWAGLFELSLRISSGGSDEPEMLDLFDRFADLAGIRPAIASAPNLPVQLRARCIDKFAGYPCQEAFARREDLTQDEEMAVVRSPASARAE